MNILFAASEAFPFIKRISFFSKKSPGFERERLHIRIDGATVLIALIIEQPIPDEPPVMMITDVFLKDSKDSIGVGILGLVDANAFDRTGQNRLGIFCAHVSRGGGVNRLR